MTTSKPHYFWKVLSPNIITLGIRGLTYEFGGTCSVHNTDLWPLLQADFYHYWAHGYFLFACLLSTQVEKMSPVYWGMGGGPLETPNETQAFMRSVPGVASGHGNSNQFSEWAWHCPECEGWYCRQKSCPPQSCAHPNPQKVCAC